MPYWKLLIIPISARTKLSVEQCSTTPTNMEDMDSIPYASEIGSLMYVMVFTRPYITQAM